MEQTIQQLGKGRTLLNVLREEKQMGLKGGIYHRTQIDLPPSQRSGLVEATRILAGVPGIAFIELNQKDIVRHKLVTRIVEAYEKFEKARLAARRAEDETPENAAAPRGQGNN